jgi:hypothetical protein
MMAGSGIISSMKAIGNDSVRRCLQPYMNTTAPQSTPSMEIRARNNSDPSVPAISTPTLARTISRPAGLGWRGNFVSSSRRSHARYNASGTMRKPCEALSSVAKSCTSLTTTWK